MVPCTICLFVRNMLIIFWNLVKSQMQPGDPEARGAEPERRVAEAPARTPDLPPEFAHLRRGSFAHEHRQVRIDRRRRPWTRRDQQRVPAQVFEDGDVGIAGSGKMAGERHRIRLLARKHRRIDKNEFRRLPQRIPPQWRMLPEERLRPRRGQQPGIPATECIIVLEKLEQLAKGQGTVLRVEPIAKPVRNGVGTRAPA